VERPTVDGSLYFLPNYGINKPWTTYGYGQNKVFEKYTHYAYDTIDMYRANKLLSTGSHLTSASEKLTWKGF
jgi:hypothetical protein